MISPVAKFSKSHLRASNCVTYHRDLMKACGLSELYVREIINSNKALAITGGQEQCGYPLQHWPRALQVLHIQVAGYDHDGVLSTIIIAVFWGILNPIVQ